jgi:hypothetical protein
MFSSFMTEKIASTIFHVVPTGVERGAYHGCFGVLSESIGTWRILVRYVRQ